MKRLATAAAIAALTATPALAHTGVGGTSGLVAGFVHPLMGVDHLLAMVTVGLWSGFALPRHVWAGAASFLAAMAAGAALAWGGVALPFVEGGITLSVIAFGLMTVFARPGQGLAASAATLAAIAGFAIFHGHAHASEATGAALAYLAGFLTATAALHLAGIGLARAVADGRLAALLPRGIGGAVAVAGMALMLG